MKEKNLQLNETGDRTVFKVPEMYFENFEAQLQQRIDALETEANLPKERVEVQKESKRFILKMDSIRPVLYMAAMFVLLIFSMSLILNLTSGKSTKLTAEDKTQSAKIELTAEDYLISSVGSYGITQYYVDPESFD